MSGGLRVGFAGDVSFTGAFARPMAPDARFAPEVLGFLAANHHNVLNVEGPVTDRPAREGIGPTVTSPPAAAADALARLGGVWNLANNHTLDSGPRGLDDTLALAERQGARVLGAGRTLREAAATVVLEGAGVRVGMLALCDRSGVAAGDGSPGVLTHDREDLVRAAIASLRADCDWVVVNYHGGEEFTFVPMPARRRRLLRYLDLGADVVVAHHAHTVQGWERRGRKLVFYGLGNFVFDYPVMLRRPGTYEGMLLRLEFGRDGVEFETLFTRADRAAGRVLAGPPVPSFAPVESRGLRRAWCRDAYRVVTLPRVPAVASAAASADTVSGNAASVDAAAPVPVPAAPGRKLLSLGRLRGLAFALRSPNYRGVVLGAVEHVVRRRLGAAAAPRE